MVLIKKGERVFQSLEEVRKAFLPKASTKRLMSEMSKDPRKLGTELARQSLASVRRK